MNCVQPMLSFGLFWAVAIWPMSAVGQSQNPSAVGQSQEPKVLLYHSFDRGLDKPDFSTAPVRVSVTGNVAVREDGVRGRAVEFAEHVATAQLTIDLQSWPSDAGTVALWEILDSYEPLTVATQNLLTVLDTTGQPIFRIEKSGHVYYWEGGKKIHLECFDCLWFSKFDRHHFAITWDNSIGQSEFGGLLMAYWQARPYAALTIDLAGRRPATLVIGDGSGGCGVDELYLLDRALPLRAIWELMQYRAGNMAELEQQLAQRCRKEANRPAAVRRASWRRALVNAIVVEAESAEADHPLKIQSSPVQGKTGVWAADNGANVASGKAYVAQAKSLRLNVSVPRDGQYAMALRYCMQRRMHPLWPQQSAAKTPWSENYATIRVHLDGKPLAGDGLERLYPTGQYSGHSGDVLPWAWHCVAGGKKVAVKAGSHVIELWFENGLAVPDFDALVLTPEPGLQPPLPRMVDDYRIPPSWWVESHQTALRGGRRIDTYVVQLRNRCEEPCAYEVVVTPPNFRPGKQHAVAEQTRIELGPFEERPLTIIFDSPADLKGDCQWAEIYLWNEDVSCQQMYRLWNNIPVPGFEGVKHPVLVPPPDPTMQEKFRKWLATRDESLLTPELRQWAAGPKPVPQLGLGAKRTFTAPLLGKRLEALDRWMAMDEKALEEYLPHGPAEEHGYGTGFDRVGHDYSGAWYKQPQLASLEPDGDIDLVTSVTFEAPDLKHPSKKYTKTYTADKDLDVISAVRDRRFQEMIEQGYNNSGVGLLAEAYYLTGDPAYAQKAVQMLRVFARRYHSFTRHFYFQIHREDRGWWGGRVNGRYMNKYGPRTLQSSATTVLDLIWDAISPADRTMIEHNLMRWGMYEGMNGPLMQFPDQLAAANREDFPYIALGNVLGDPEPRNGLKYFYEIYKDVVLDDGLHICSIGSYGGVQSYVKFMRKLAELGVDVSQNTGLRNAFLAQPRFIFAGGGMPNIDDGGGMALQGLGAGFGCPDEDDYRWAQQMYGDPLLEQMPALIAEARKVANAPPEKRLDTLHTAYASGKHDLDALWPAVFVAQHKGMAMLRNRTPAHPADWVEVIFDYGRYGGRAHGHPAKLATIPSMNGQIVSMDYGYGWFGNPSGPGWHVRSYAHNVVVVDGSDQRGAVGPVPRGRLREARADGNVQWIDAESDLLYDGVYMRRVLFTTDAGIVDLFLCRSDVEHQYDWMFHSFGVADANLGLASAPKLADSGPLSFAISPRVGHTDGDFQVLWENSPLTNPPKKSSTALLGEKTFVRLWALGDRNTQVALFAGPISPDLIQDGQIDYLMIRRTAKTTLFATVQEPWRQSTGPKIRAVRLLPVTAEGKPIPHTDACALEITRTDGTKRVFFVNFSGGQKSVGDNTITANIACWQ